MGDNRVLKAVAITLLFAAATAGFLWEADFAAPDHPTIRQAWASSGTNYDETDSLAVCPSIDGRVVVFASSKKGHRLDLFDAGTGKFVRRFGTQGTGPGALERPNGVVAARMPATKEGAAANGESERWIVFVIERGSHRVQGIWADDLSAAGTFGEGDLTRPYGGAVAYRDGRVHLYVTDTRCPPDERVRVYAIERKGDGIAGRLVRSFGDKEGPGVIHTPESICVDDRLGRVLCCDEEAGYRDVKVYSLDGRFTGTVFAGSEIRREPEGIVVVGDDPGGFIVVTDQQKKLSVWHLYDRETYAHLGAFTGEPRIANTDGIAVYEDALPGLPGGALFAVHDDADVRAYDLNDIRALATRGRAPKVAADEP